MAQHEHCPSCGQRTFIYARSISANQIRALLLLNEHEDKWIGVKTTQLSINVRLVSDFPKLRFWGLINRGSEHNTWRITETGVAFLKGEIPVDKYVFIFNNETQEQPEDSKVKQKKVYWYDLVKVPEPDLESACRDATRFDDGMFIINKQ